MEAPKFFTSGAVPIDSHHEVDMKLTTCAVRVHMLHIHKHQATCEAPFFVFKFSDLQPVLKRDSCRQGPASQRKTEVGK